MTGKKTFRFPRYSKVKRFNKELKIMASPNTGLFASSFIDGFLQQKKEQKDRLDKNKIIKLQTKLIEQQLLSGKIKLEARTTVADIMAAAASGVDDAAAAPPPPDIFGTGLGGDFANPAQNIPGAGIDSLDLPSMMAALMDNPEFISAAVQSGQLDLGDFIDRQGQGTSFSRDAADAGILPGTPEFREAFLAKNKADEQSQVLGELMANIRLEQVEKATGERQDKERERAQGLVRGRVAIRNHFSLVNEAVEKMRDLQKTVLQSGIPGGDQLRDVAAIVGAVQEFFGKESPQAKVITDKRDRLKKLLAVTMAQSLESMRGTMSVVRINSMLASLPTLENSDVANAQLFSDQMRSLLDEADINGFVVGGREFIESFIADPLAGLTQAKESVRSFDGPAFIDSATGKARSAFDSASEKARSGFDAATVFAQDTADRARPTLNAAANKARSGFDAASDVTQRKLAELQQIDFSKLSEEQLDAIAKIAQAGAKKVQSGLATAAEIAEMSIKQLNQLDLQGMGEDALKAAEKRWKKLHAK